MGAFLPPHLCTDVVTIAPEARKIRTFDGEVCLNGTTVEELAEEAGHLVNDSLRNAEVQSAATERLAEQNHQVAARSKGTPKGSPAAAAAPLYRGYTQAQWDEWNRSWSATRPAFASRAG